MENGSITTDIFTKHTDNHLYVDKISEHPNTTKNAIPYGLVIRACRICSREERYQKQSNMEKRGYKRRELENI